MNVGQLVKAFDTIMALRDAVRRVGGGASASAPRGHGPDGGVGAASPSALEAAGAHIETRLTGVVVAALKEAFARDHARLELDRQQMEEQRLRAEAALRLELRRQAVERELGRLRLLAITAFAGWVGSLLLLGWRIPLASPLGRGLLALGWVLLLAAIGWTFTVMGRVSATAAEDPGATHAPALASTSGPTWLLVAGLALTASSLLL